MYINLVDLYTARGKVSKNEAIEAGGYRLQRIRHAMLEALALS